MRVLCKTCVVCGERAIVDMPDEAYYAYLEGEFIQDAWPEGGPQEREMIISGTHPRCFDQLFPREFTDDEC